MSPEEKKTEAPRTIGDFLKFTFWKMIEKKKLYLFPMWILLAAIALLLVLSGNSHLLPAIYIAF
ncbi:MAG: DUF5989 family protein [Bacteriovoracia bacterium]